MVFFFTVRGGAVVNPSSDGPATLASSDVTCYMGTDKHENEHLIEWGLRTDVWFHVERMSSAHVYLRLPRGVGIDQIPAETLEDACQLTKANSIEGCKKSHVQIVYTPWANLHKTADMAVGSIGFHSARA